MGILDRAEVYKAIDAERIYQDQAYPESGGVLPGEAETKTLVNLALPPSDELRLIRAYLHQADMAWLRSPDDQTTGMKVNPSDLHVIRKIAAIAVRCMENHGIVDRGCTTVRREPLPTDPNADAMLQSLKEVERLVKEGIAKGHRVAINIGCPGVAHDGWGEGSVRMKARMIYTININIG